MDIYSWIALLTLIITAAVVWNTPKRKGHKNSLLDTSGIILNVVLIIMVYPPLAQAVGLLGGGQAASGVSVGLAMIMGRLMPAVSVAGVGASVVLRRKGMSGMSFLLQFTGGVWFGIAALIGKLAGHF